MDAGKCQAGLSDCLVQILVGQARILTLAEELPRKGRQEAVIAEGDPSVVLATLLSPRQIRLLGLRVGVTDLTITTADGRIYTFEVRVGVDLGMEVAINTTLRLFGINAPEMSTQAGKDAKAWAISWLTQHCPDGQFTISFLP